MTCHTFDPSPLVAASSALRCGNDRIVGRLEATVRTAATDLNPLAERWKP